jgi:drug/metabolite transporter (DMT)-like permease
LVLLGTLGSTLFFMKESSSKNESLLLLGMVLSMFIWGLSWPSGKILGTYGNAVTMAYCRFFVTFWGLLPIVLLAKESLQIKKEGWMTLALAGICMSAYNYFFFQGLSKGMAGAGGVLVTTLNPIIAYSIGVVLKRQWPNRNEAIGLAIGVLAGCFLLKIWEKSDAIFSAGNLYFLLASFTWAILSKFTAKASRFGSPMSFSLWMYLICSAIMFALADKSALFALLPRADGYFWGNLLFSAVITTSLATTFYFYATSRIGAEKASSFIFLVPAGAAFSAWMFLHEHIEWNTLVGGALGAVAVLMIQRK